VDGKKLSLHLKNNFIVLVIVIFIAIFPLFIIGVAAQSPIQVGGFPEDMAYDPVNKRMYLTNNADDTVSVIDTTTNNVVGNPIKVGDVPAGITYDPENKRMYVDNHDDDTVSVINLW